LHFGPLNFANSTHCPIPLQLTEKVHPFGHNLPDIYNKNATKRAYVTKISIATKSITVCTKKIYYYNKIIIRNCKKPMLQKKWLSNIFLMQFDLQQILPVILTKSGNDYNKNHSLLQK
jgi:hypothetical protein